MPRVNTRECAAMISTRTPFTSHGAISGAQDRENYVVRSYSTPILVINQDERRAYFNGAKYSVTTSKHQTQCAIATTQLGFSGWEVIGVTDTEEFETLTGYRVARY